MALADSRITVCHQREAGTHNRGSSGTFRPRFRVRFPWLFLAVVCHAGMAHNRSGGAPPQCGRPGRGSNAHQSLAQPVSKRIAPSRLVALAWRSTGPPGAFLHKPQTKPIRQRHLARKGCPCVPNRRHAKWFTANFLKHKVPQTMSITQQLILGFLPSPALTHPFPQSLRDHLHPLVSRMPAHASVLKLALSTTQICPIPRWCANVHI